MWNSCLESSALSTPHLAPPLHSVLTANLYSDIKPDDSPVKGTKRGKGKKDKRKAVEPFEKKKPKLDELKVLAAASTLAAESNSRGSVTKKKVPNS